MDKKFSCKYLNIIILKDVPENAQDLTIFVQNLLEQMVTLIHFSICIILF